jgi:hypothetical protein
MPIAALRFELSIEDPWDFSGPDGDNRASVLLLGQVNGPTLPNWQPTYLLLQVERPFELDGERALQLVAAPRYEGVSIEQVITIGGTVGVARVRDGTNLTPGASFNAEQVKYCIIGDLRIPDSRA